MNAKPIATLSDPPATVAEAALARARTVRRHSLILVLRDGGWLLGRETARFVAEAECGRGRIVGRLNRDTPAASIAALVEAARV